MISEIYPSDLDEFLVEQGMKSSGTPGKLKYFYELEEYPGWYAFVFENRSFFCTVDSGIQLGTFVKVSDGSVKLNPKLEEELNGRREQDRS